MKNRHSPANRQRLSAVRRYLIVTTYLITAAVSANGKTGIFAQSITHPATTDHVELEIENTYLNLCGEASLKAYRIFTVGQGALYRPDCNAEWKLDDTEPKVMLFRYGRDIPARAFSESAITLLKRNLQLDSEQLGELAAFHEFYRDVQDGDTYAIKYSPQQGLQLFLNDELLGKLTTQPLASQYFSIWLGEAPFDESLKAQLLGL